MIYHYNYQLYYSVIFEDFFKSTLPVMVKNSKTLASVESCWEGVRNKPGMA